MSDLISLLILFSFPILAFIVVFSLILCFINLMFKSDEIKLIKKDEKDMKF